MKKVYASLALALAVAGSASATPFAATKTVALEPQEFSGVLPAMPAQLSPIQNDNQMMKAPAQPGVGSCFYVWNWYSLSNQDNGLQTDGIEIYIDGTDATILGLFNLASVKGTYDPSTGILSIPNKQQLLYTGEGGAPLYLYTMAFDVDAENKITNKRQVANIQLQYCPQGLETTSGEVMLVGGWYTDQYNMFEVNTESNIAANNNRGYQWSYGNMMSEPGEYYGYTPFKYDESSWKAVGQAKLSDGWMRAWDGEERVYDVDCAIKGSEVVLLNPYGKNTPYAAVDSDTGVSINPSLDVPGFIVLDISDPNCVLVKPFINSGFNAQYFFGFVENEGDTEVMYPVEKPFIACTSYEAENYYCKGWLKEEIIEEAEMYGDELPTMTSTGLVSLPNCRILNPRTDPMYLVFSQWQGSNNGQAVDIPMETTIELPAAALAGVQAITVEDANAPARYFNLQGVEIANPEAGQIVIVKNGNKATKTIAK